ncbi:MAG: hypothetical protein HYU36_23365 [Planctomycetes bacterium]|nr:hypothetical protein [Planctomycetota bacterium]
MDELNSRDVGKVQDCQSWIGVNHNNAVVTFADTEKVGMLHRIHGPISRLESGGNGPMHDFPYGFADPILMADRRQSTIHQASIMDG